MKNINSMGTAIAVSLFFGSCLTGTAFAAWPTPVSLLTADSFAVIAGSTVTGPGIVTGNLGLSPGTSVTGFPPGILNGIKHVANATAVQAQNDFLTAYNNLAAEVVTSTVPTELGGTTKNPGVYDSAAGTFGITGTVTLDALGDPNAVFIFKSSSTLTTAGSSIVMLTNGAQACNVFWYVGSSATLGASSVFKGNILALTSATLTTSANVEWRVFARNGAVTLDNNTVKRAVCLAPPSQATLNVVKTVVGGTAASSDFYLHVNQSGSDVLGSPNLGAASPGVAYVLSAGSYSIDEDTNTKYTKTYSWDCSSTGSIVLAAGQTKTCNVTNTYIAPVSTGSSATNAIPYEVSHPGTVMTWAIVPPVQTALAVPRINIVKTSSRRTPFLYGGGYVTYFYKVTNPGIAVLHSVSLTDDKCTSVNLISGDLNSNLLLEPNETWSFSCKMRIRVTNTNIATVQGTANEHIAYAQDMLLVKVHNAELIPESITIPTVRFPNAGIYDGSSESTLKEFFQNLGNIMSQLWK